MNIINRSQPLKILVSSMSFVLSLSFISTTFAAPLDLINVRSKIPMLPNVMLTVDDSGSTLDWYMNDEKKAVPIFNYLDDLADPYLILDWRDLNSQGNVVYYNTEVDYQPWPGFEQASVDQAFNEYGEFSFTIWDDKAGYNDIGGKFLYTKKSNGIMDYWDNYDKVSVINGEFIVERITYSGKSNEACFDPTSTYSYSDFLDSAALIEYEECALGRKTKEKK